MQDWKPSDLQDYLEKGERVFLKLWKRGCGPCKLSTPAIERIEAANAHGLVFGQICTDDYPEMFEIAETDVLPTFFVFAEGALKGKTSGFKGLEKLKEFIEGAMH